MMIIILKTINLVILNLLISLQRHKYLLLIWINLLIEKRMKVEYSELLLCLLIKYNIILLNQIYLFI